MMHLPCLPRRFGGGIEEGGGAQDLEFEVSHPALLFNLPGEKIFQFLHDRVGTGKGRERGPLLVCFAFAQVGKVFYEKVFFF